MSAAGEVAEERRRQEARWGQQDHAPAFWMLILGEEVGEAQKAALEASWGGGSTWGDYRAELVQVAAVALAAIESLDRNGPPLPECNPRALGVSCACRGVLGPGARHGAAGCEEVAPSSSS